MDFKELLPPYYLTYLHILCGDLLTKTVSIGSLKVNGFIYGKIFKKSIYIYFGWNLQEFKISFNMTQKSINFKQKKILYVNEMYVRFTKKQFGIRLKF